MPPFVVRSATLSDTDAIAAVHYDSIHSLGPRFYAASIVEVWGVPRTGKGYAKAMESGQMFFIATRLNDPDNHVLGFSSYQLVDGKHTITAIYVRGEAARSGIGTALYQ